MSNLILALDGISMTSKCTYTAITARKDYKIGKVNKMTSIPTQLSHKAQFDCVLSDCRSVNVFFLFVKDSWSNAA